MARIFRRMETPEEINRREGIRRIIQRLVRSNTFLSPAELKELRARALIRPVGIKVP